MGFSHSPGPSPTPNFPEFPLASSPFPRLAGPPRPLLARSAEPGKWRAGFRAREPPPPVHHPERPAGSTHSSTRGLKTPDNSRGKRGSLPQTPPQSPAILRAHQARAGPSCLPVGGRNDRAGGQGTPGGPVLKASYGVVQTSPLSSSRTFPSDKDASCPFAVTPPAAGSRQSALCPWICVSCSEQGSVVCRSLWSCTKSDMTE